MSRKIFIYGLKDPRDGRIKYVGQTVSMASRIAAHISSSFNGKSNKDAWLRELNAAGLSAEPVVLETCDEEHAHDAESRWVEHARGLGEIFNGKVEERAHMLPEKSQRIVVTLTKEKRAVIEAAVRSKGITLTRFCEEAAYSAAISHLSASVNGSG